jgi:hypothetical protein
VNNLFLFSKKKLKKKKEREQEKSHTQGQENPTAAPFKTSCFLFPDLTPYSDFLLKKRFKLLFFQ